MKTVYKYKLEEGGLISAIFKKEDILHVGYDANNNPSFWALVNTDDDASTGRCRIFQIGTGWDLDELEHIFEVKFTDENYLGTLKDGPYIWHYFIEFLEEEEQ